MRPIGRERETLGMLGAREHQGQAVDQCLVDIVFLLELARPHTLLQGLHQLHGRRHAEIRLDQQLLDLFEVGGLEPAHQRTDIGEHDALETAPQAQFLLSHPAECHAGSLIPFIEVPISGA